MAFFLLLHLVHRELRQEALAFERVFMLLPAFDIANCLTYIEFTMFKRLKRKFACVDVRVRVRVCVCL